MIFKELVSRKPIRGIIHMTELGSAAVYGKIDFIHAQCLGFAAERERRLQNIVRKSVRLVVDRQDYMINWPTKRKRKTIQMSAICTVEARSRYVLGHHLNYDPDILQEDIETAAIMNGDYQPDRRSYFRAHPQYWLRGEFSKAAIKSKTGIRPDLDEEALTVDELINETRKLAKYRTHPEHADMPGPDNQMPRAGVMTHLDYTAYAHARLIRRFLSNTKYINIYSDQDEVLRGAFLSAFASKVVLGQCEMSFVQFQKKMNIDEKRELQNDSSKLLATLAGNANQAVSDFIRTSMAEEYARHCKNEPDWRKRWVVHPKNTLNEPLRRILYLTDTGDKTPEEIGWVLSQATLAAVDTYFMRLRRKVQYFERPIPTRSNADALWAGYHAYDPWRVVQLLDIFRVYTNFIWKRSNGQTPAMAFGLAKGPLRFEDILYWRPEGFNHGLGQPRRRGARKKRAKRDIADQESGVTAK